MTPYEDLARGVARKIKIDYSDADLARFDVQNQMDAQIRFLLNVLPAKFLEAHTRTIRRNFYAGQSQYKWPADFIRIRTPGLWVRFSNQQEFREAGDRPEQTAGSWNSLDLQPADQYPIVTLDGENGFIIKPAPAADVVEGWRLRYVFSHPPVSSQQKILMNVKWNNLIEIGTAARCAQIGRSKMDLAAELWQLHDAELEKLLPKKENQ